MDTGKIVNLSQIDCQQVFKFSSNGYVLLTAPLTFLISISLIIFQVGYIGFIGLAIILVGNFFNTFFRKKMQLLRKEKMKYCDERCQMLSEFLNGIKLIKYYGWEMMSINRIMNTRDKETKI